MPKELERDLGLFAVLAISIGAMIGSGIFILPGLALAEAGPAVILAYLLAGVLVLPAALSKAEMATAMPEAGGTYIYIERGMGPILGTIAGIGTWFSLSFKSALALVGGMPYLAVVFDIPQTTLALVLCAVLIVVNVTGVKQTGRMQVLIVGVMLAAMVWFVGESVSAVETVRYEGFFGAGADGLLAATGLVFVSFAGVTKVASVAEEVENPDRNIPLGILGSLAFTTVLYVAIVAIVVGVVPGPDLLDSYTPMTDVATLTMGDVGIVAIVIAAILALLSTANAGILSSSRYPFAMSRDALAPALFENVSDRFQTPRNAITITGLVMLGLIAFVPILSIAKLASAFKILVFALVNAALIAFRESEVADYDPAFRAPLYPWTQLFGIGGSAVLLTQMGLIPVLGAIGIIVGGLAWYVLFARKRIDRNGVAVDAIRRSLGRHVADRTSDKRDVRRGKTVVVGVPRDADPQRTRQLHVAASAAAAGQVGSVSVLRYDSTPERVATGDRDRLGDGPVAELSADEAGRRIDLSDLGQSVDVPVEVTDATTTDPKRALVDHVRRVEADRLLLEREPSGAGSGLPPEDLEWVVREAPAEVLLLDGRAGENVGDVAVVVDRSGHDPAKVRVADDIATAMGGTVDLVYGVSSSASTDQHDSVATFLEDLANSCRSPVETVVTEARDERAAVSAAAADADLVVVGPQARSVRRRLFGWPTLADSELSRTQFVEIHDATATDAGVLRRIAERTVD